MKNHDKIFCHKKF